MKGVCCNLNVLNNSSEFDWLAAYFHQQCFETNWSMELNSFSPKRSRCLTLGSGQTFGGIGRQFDCVRCRVMGAILNGLRCILRRRFGKPWSSKIFQIIENRNEICPRFLTTSNFYFFPLLRSGISSKTREYLIKLHFPKRRPTSRCPHLICSFASLDIWGIILRLKLWKKDPWLDGYPYPINHTPTGMDNEKCSFFLRDIWERQKSTCTTIL